jgi:hypothetical protein
VLSAVVGGQCRVDVSRIALDRDAAERQRRMLTATLAMVAGPRRLPLLIIDSPSAVRQERSSIRGAAVLGVMNIGRDPVFALDDEHCINAAAVENFLQRHGRTTFLISASRRWSGHAGRTTQACICASGADRRGRPGFAGGTVSAGGRDRAHHADR